MEQLSMVVGPPAVVLSPSRRVSRQTEHSGVLGRPARAPPNTATVYNVPPLLQSTPRSPPIQMNLNTTTFNTILLTLSILSTFYSEGRTYFPSKLLPFGRLGDTRGPCTLLQMTGWTALRH